MAYRYPSGPSTKSLCRILYPMSDLNTCLLSVKLTEAQREFWGCSRSTQQSGLINLVLGNALFLAEAIKGICPVSQSRLITETKLGDSSSTPPPPLFYCSALARAPSTPWHTCRKCPLHNQRASTSTKAVSGSKASPSHSCSAN